ncbi:MAG: hypothetical protein NZ927_05315 [Candidatus Calescibacterium sp.]|nr:hypothetical protein [Candidatus Calescibacterium sp.]MCX7733214.1 hypothetical protein [bacterium]MDW8086921.1 hypothetical protein [Candidatus Calescibacterium sp.]
MRQKKVIAFGAGMLMLHFITHSSIPLILALVFSFMELFAEKISERVFRFIEKVFSAVGNAIFTFILAVVFYLIITPLGILWRLSKKQKVSGDSYYKVVNKSFSLSNFQKQY